MLDTIRESAQKLFVRAVYTKYIKVAVHHHPGMMEPMMMMGMIDNSAVGLNYSTNRTAFPPPQAHAVVPNAMSNHLPPQPIPPQNPQPMTSVPASSSSNSKPKKQRKKKSADGMITLKPDDEASRLKKKKSCKPKQKNKPRIKPVDGSECS